MKIKEITSDNSSIGEFGERKARFDDNQLAFMFDMLSKQMYKDPIGTLVREYTSNCFDSHVEAQVNDAVVVGFEYEDGETYCVFKDVGVGLSSERMEEVFNVYFKSTKRDTNEQIGGFGLGSKSGLAYRDDFIIDTIYNGVNYIYSYSKNDGGIPEYFVIDEKPTTERNGTTIKICLNKLSDKASFERAFKEQLGYFDNVYFVNTSIDNNYKIYEFKTFKYRPNHFNVLHVILGKVYYPIDFNILDEEHIHAPFGLKFEVGELSVIPSREALRYDEDTKKVLKKRIQQFKDEIQAIYSERKTTLDNYTQVAEFYLHAEDSRFVYFEAGSHACQFQKWTGLDIAKLDMSCVKGFTPNMGGWDIVGRVDAGRFVKDSGIPYITKKELQRILDSQSSIWYTENPEGKINDKLAYEIKEGWILRYKKDKHLALAKHAVEEAKSKYKKEKTVIGVAANVYKWFTWVKKYFRSIGSDLDDVQISEDTIKYFKSLRSSVRLRADSFLANEEIKFKVLRTGQRAIITEEAVHKVKFFKGFKGITVYGNAKELPELKLIYNMLQTKYFYRRRKEVVMEDGKPVLLDNGKKKMRTVEYYSDGLNCPSARVIVVNKDFNKYLSEFGEVYHINEFKEHFYFIKFATAFRLHQLGIDKYLKAAKELRLDKINSDLHSLVEELKLFMAPYKIKEDTGDSIKWAIDYVRERNLWWKDAALGFKVLRDYFKGFEFLLEPRVLSYMSIEHIISLLKENGRKVNNIYYKQESIAIPKPKLMSELQREIIFPTLIKNSYGNTQRA